MKSVKKIILAVLIAVCCAPGTDAWAQQTIGVPISGSGVAHNVVYEKKLRETVEFMSDTLLQGRATGTRGNAEAAFWISRKFSALGLMPVGDTWNHHFYGGPGTMGHNIMAFMPASRKAAAKVLEQRKASLEDSGPGASSSHNRLQQAVNQKDTYTAPGFSKAHPAGSQVTGTSRKYVIVAAHYDGLGTIGDICYPGADSDASGIAALVSVAEMFTTMSIFGRSYSKNILFVAIDAKYRSLRGSDALWRMLEQEELTDPVSGEPITTDKVDMMFNIDQIGGVSSTLRDGREDYVIILGKDSLGRYWKDFIASNNERFGIGLEVAYDYYGSKDFTTLFYRRISDQRKFVENGRPALMATSGITMMNNKATDTPDTIDYGILKRRIYLIFHLLEDFCSSN